MAKFIARARHARHWLYPAILFGMFLAGCSGGGPGSSGAGDPGSVPGPVVPNPPAGGPGAATDTVIGLSWAPSSDSVSGYIIYYGPTQDSTPSRAVQLSLAAFEDSLAPSYSFNAGTDLGLSHGERVCFRLSSYKGADESDLSQPACADL